MTDKNGKYVLGISSYFHDSSAALVVGDTVVSAAQEERFTRRKADSTFPDNAINYCLSSIPHGEELYAIAYYEDPSQKIDRILRNGTSKSPRGTAIWTKTLQTLQILNKTLPHKLTSLIADSERIFFSPHHRSHAASAYLPSPFQEAAILVADGVGEWATTSIWHGSNGNLDAIRQIRFPHSLGLLYSAFTQYCGFRVNSGEYKLMGLAPFGKPLFKSLIYENLIEVDTEGSYTLNLDYFSFETGLSTISPLFYDLFQYPPRQPHEPISIHYMNVAASIQSVLNEIMVSLAHTALRLTGSSNLCLAGGVALNCVTNSEIARNTRGLKGIWVQPAAGDAGGALGAALDISQSLQETRGERNELKPDGMSYAYLGPSYSEEQILEVLERRELVWESYDGDEESYIEAVSSALQEGSIVGYFDGRMEFGPRALGNRSILADPRPKDMLQRVNRNIKFREGWRPLAPVILAEYADQLFDAPTSDPYMLFVSQLRESYCNEGLLKELRRQGMSELHQYLSHEPSQFPAVTHYDYSARTQFLTQKANPRLHGVLSSFYASTGCPMLLNTSFNVRGEPIVCGPEDAVNVFVNTHIDILAIGPFIVRRSAQSSKINIHIGKRKFNAD